MDWLELAMVAHGGKPGDPLLELDLDELYTAGYFHSEYDLSGAGHSRLILAKDKEAFLNEHAAEFRRRPPSGGLYVCRTVFQQISVMTRFARGFDVFAR